MNDKKSMSVFLLELKIITIIFTMTELAWFLAGDLKTFGIAFLGYFIPSMYTINVILRENIRFNELIHKMYMKRLTIVVLIAVTAGAIYRFIYTFDWLISGYAHASSIFGLLIATIIIFYVIMDLNIKHKTLRKLVIGYCFFLLICIPVGLLGVWYYSQYGVIKINRVAVGEQPLFVYMAMLSGVQMLLFYDRENSYYIFFKRSITSIIIIIMVIFGLFSIFGLYIIDPNGPSAFTNVYDKMMYVFEFAHPDLIVTIMATMNLFHYIFLMAIATIGIKNLYEDKFEYIQDKHLTEVESKQIFMDRMKRKTVNIFVFLVISIELVGYYSGQGEIFVSTYLAIFSFLILAILISAITFKLRPSIMTFICNVSILVTIIAGFYTMWIY